MADSMKVGGGGRYKKLVKKLASEGAKDPRALAAYIGRKKYGKAKFQEMAAKGK
jgi:histidyl-tRNA synthetase